MTEGAVQSLGRGLEVLALLNTQESMVTIASCAKDLGMSRAASRRYLLTLRDLGYCEESGAAFVPTLRSWDLPYGYLSARRHLLRAVPLMKALAERLQDSTSLTIFDGSDVVYIARAKGARLLSANLRVGARVPAYLLSSGRVLLGGLSDEGVNEYLRAAELVPRTPNTVTDPELLRQMVLEAREQGWSIADEELELGLRSIAAPVRVGGRVVAAINVSTHVSRMSVAEMAADWAPELVNCAEAIGSILVEPVAG